MRPCHGTYVHAAQSRSKNLRFIFYLAVSAFLFFYFDSIFPSLNPFFGSISSQEEISRNTLSSEIATIFFLPVGPEDVSRSKTLLRTLGALTEINVFSRSRFPNIVVSASSKADRNDIATFIHRNSASPVFRNFAIVDDGEIFRVCEEFLYMKLISRSRDFFENVPNYNSWQRQQLLKLCFAACLKACSLQTETKFGLTQARPQACHLFNISIREINTFPRYITIIDSDTLAIRPLTRENFFDGRGRACAGAGYLHRAWWESSARVMSIGNSSFPASVKLKEFDQHKIGFGVSPATISINVAFRAILNLAMGVNAGSDSRSSILSLLLQQSWTEYSAYCLSFESVEEFHSVHNTSCLISYYGCDDHWARASDVYNYTDAICNQKKCLFSVIQGESKMSFTDHGTFLDLDRTVHRILRKFQDFESQKSDVGSKLQRFQTFLKLLCDFERSLN